MLMWVVVWVVVGVRARKEKEREKEKEGGFLSVHKPGGWWQQANPALLAHVKMRCMARKPIFLLFRWLFG